MKKYFALAVAVLCTIVLTVTTAPSANAADSLKISYNGWTTHHGTSTTLEINGYCTWNSWNHNPKLVVTLYNQRLKVYSAKQTLSDKHTYGEASYINVASPASKTTKFTYTITCYDNGVNKGHKSHVFTV